MSEFWLELFYIAQTHVIDLKTPWFKFFDTSCPCAYKEKRSKIKDCKILYLDNSTCVNEQIVYISEIKEKEKVMKKESVVTRVTTELVYKIN